MPTVGPHHIPHAPEPVMGDTRRLVCLSLLALVVSAGAAFAQARPSGVPRLPPPRPPAPAGHEIETADGDTVIVDGDDRVVVVRRRQADVRVVASAETRSMTVMADWPTYERPVDGRVDRVWRMEDVGDGWPLGARWQGAVTVLEPESLRGGSNLGVAMLVLETPAGVVAFRANQDPTPRGDHLVVTYGRFSAADRDGLSFEEAERDAASPTARWSLSTMSMSVPVPPVFPMPAASGVPTGGVSGGGVAGAQWGPVASGRPPAPGAEPLQVLRRVDPAWPDPATMPGVQGLIRVRVAVDAKGLVRDAVVLQSVPGLDAIALAAARQWRFAPTGIASQPFVIVWPYPARPR